MSESPASEALEALDELAWMRRLARALVRDDAAADDLVQDVLVSALEHPPTQDITWRAAIAGRMRQRLRSRHRAEVRRADRELANARSEGADDEQALTRERYELCQLVLNAARALDEPYRSTIRLRFLEDLSPSEIAERTHTSVETVKTRLKRGLAMLRARLDRDHGGDRSVWLAALAPLARDASRAPLAKPSSWALRSASFAFVTLAGALVFWLVHDGGSSAPTRARSETALVELSGTKEEAGTSSPLPRPSSDERSAAAIEEAQPEVSARGVWSSGIVVDLEGHPVPGVTIGSSDRSSEKRESALSDAAGRFRLRASRTAMVIARDERYFTLFADQSDAHEELVITVAPARHMHGFVRGDGGAPLEMARLVLTLDGDPAVQAAHTALDPIVFTRPIERFSWDDGHFVIEAAPDLPAHLSVSASGYATRVVDVPAGTHDEFDVQLARPSGRNVLLRGTLAGLDPDESAELVLMRGNERLPLESAWVEPPATGAQVVSFEFALERDTLERALVASQSQPLDPRGCGLSLWAVAEHHQSAHVDLACLDDIGTPQLHLELGGPSLSIQGEMLDADGAPVLDGGDVWYERLDGRPELRERDRPEILDGNRFEIRGLDAGSYRIGFFAISAAQHGELAPVSAGSSGVELRLARESDDVLHAGVIVDGNGRPIEGVQVFTLEPHAKDAVDRGRTDENGRFSFEASARTSSLHIYPSDRYHEIVALPEPASRSELRIVHPLHLRLGVDLRDSERVADAFRVLDAAGATLELDAPQRVDMGSRMTRREFQVWTHAPLHSGRSRVIDVPDTARVLVLERDGVDVARIALELEPDQVNWVH